MAAPTLLGLVRDSPLGSVVEATAWSTAEFLQRCPASVIPATILLVAGPFYSWYYITGTRYAATSRLLWCKLICAAAILGTNLYSIFLWYQVSRYPMKEAMVAAVYSCSASLTLFFTLYCEHLFTYRSSSFLTIWLAAAISCDVMQYDIIFLLLNYPTLASTIKTGAVLKAVIIGLEEAPKLADIEDERFRKWLKPKDTTGILTRSAFLWIGDLFSIGFRNVTSMDQLPDISPDASSEILYERFSQDWVKTRKLRIKPSFTSFFFDEFALGFAILGIPTIMLELALCFPPFLISSLLSLDQSHNQFIDKDKAQWTLFATVAGTIYLAIALLRALRKHVERQFAAKVEGVLTYTIQQKLLTMSPISAANAGTDNLLNEHVAGIANNIYSVHNIWTGALMSTLYLYFLWLLMGKIAIVAVPSAIIPLLFSVVLPKRKAPTSNSFLESVSKRELRLSKISSMISQLKAIRITGLHNVILDHIYQLYSEEIESLQRSTLWDAVGISISSLFGVGTGPLLVTTALWTKSTSTQHIYTILCIQSVFTAHITNMPAAWTFLNSTLLHLDRIESYLMLPRTLDERHGVDITAPRGKAGRKAVRRQRPKNRMIDFRNVYLKASSGGATMLRATNACVQKGEMLAVVGPNGCGKSIFMRTLIGEGHLQSGSMYVKPGPIAYCAQTPWIYNSSIRQNIVAESSFDADWYTTVLEACALTDDLKRLAGGDSFVVGSGGARLSGGQKQRVSLARAVYARCNMLVLDDVFAPLDQDTAHSVFTNLFGDQGLVRRQPTTVVLVTNSIELLEHADRYLVIQANGTSNEQADFTNPLFQRWLANIQTRFDNTGFKTTDSELPAETSNERASASEDSAKKKPLRHRSSFLFYLSQFPSAMLCLEVVLTLLAAACTMSPHAYVYLFPDFNATSSWLVAGYLLLGPASAILAAVCICLWHSKLAPASSQNLHRQALETVMSCTLNALTKINKSELIYLFTNEITAALAKSLHNTILLSFFHSCNLLSAIAIAALPFGQIPTALLVGIAVLFVFKTCHGRILRNVSRMQLDSNASHSIHISETISGLPHIRSFGWQSAYSAKAVSRLRDSQRSRYCEQGISIWLTLMVDIAVAMAALYVILSSISSGTIGSGTALSLVSLAFMGESPADVVGRWNATEMVVGRIARAQNFISSCPTEKDPAKKKARVPDPKKQVGRIILNSVTSKYDTDKESPSVVNNVSIAIPGGWKVGVIGRTGSGKSSFLLTLLNFLEYSGQITIDGVNLADIPRRILRDRVITSVSQDTIDFEGSVRYNLCPWTMHESKYHGNAHPVAVYGILDSLKLWDIIEANGGLDSDMSQLKLSHGQKHLMCIARACLHKLATDSRIVLMDEASSNLDPDIEKIAHRVMRTCFEDCTVISVIHRLQTLPEYNMVFKFKDGKMSVKTQEPVIPDDNEEEEEEHLDGKENSDDGWYADSDDDDQYEPAEVEVEEEEPRPILDRPQRWRPGMPIPYGLQRVMDVTRAWDREYFRTERERRW